MIRTELLETLEVVSPALSTMDLIPVMTHFWFTGKEVMAFNDQIAISTPLKTDFTGAVPGDVFLSLLKASRSAEVTMEVSDTNLLVRLGKTDKKAKFNKRSDIKLGLLPADSFVFEMPKMQAGDPFPVKSPMNFIDDIKGCLRSVSTDTSVPDQLGVSLIPEKGFLHLFATNNSTLSHAKVELTGKLQFKQRVILSTSFCQQLLRLANPKKGLQLQIHEDHALFTSGKHTLFGRLIDSGQPIDFMQILRHHIPDNSKLHLLPIPSELRLIIERAIVITDANNDPTTTKITVEDGRMKFLSESKVRGKVFDSMKVDTKQPNVEIKLEPKLIKNGLGDFNSMFVTDKCAIMAQGDRMYLISATDA